MNVSAVLWTRSTLTSLADVFYSCRLLGFISNVPGGVLRIRCFRTRLEFVWYRVTCRGNHSCLGYDDVQVTETEDKKKACQQISMFSFTGMIFINMMQTCGWGACKRETFRYVCSFLMENVNKTKQKQQIHACSFTTVKKNCENFW